MEQPAVKLQRLYDKLRDAVGKKERVRRELGLVQAEIDDILDEIEEVDLPCPPTLRDGEG